MRRTAEGRRAGPALLHLEQGPLHRGGRAQSGPGPVTSARPATHDSHFTIHNSIFLQMLPADYHTHTPLCRHATGEPSEYAARALAAGLSEMGFSDHSPMRRDDFDNWRMRLDQLDGYVEMVRQVQKESAGLVVKLALEVDYL